MAMKWKIKLNRAKSVHVVYTLRHKNNILQVYLNGEEIPKSETAKYLGLHLDSRLNWKHHVRQKAKQIRQQTINLYWLLGKYSHLNLRSKRLIYLSIIKPIWAYGIQLWGCAHNSSRAIIQRKLQ